MWEIDIIDWPVVELTVADCQLTAVVVVLITAGNVWLTTGVTDGWHRMLLDNAGVLSRFNIFWKQITHWGHKNSIYTFWNMLHVNVVGRL